MRKLRALIVATALATLFTLPTLANLQAQSEDDFLDQLAAQAGPEPDMATADTSKGKGGQTEAYCSANCQGAGTASCSGSTCTAVDRDCSIGQTGYVTCDSATYYCDPPCLTSNCNPGAFCLNHSQCDSPNGFCFKKSCICSV